MTTKNYIPQYQEIKISFEDSSKTNVLLNFLKSINYIDKVELLTKNIFDDNILHYIPKNNYTFEDIKNLVDKFPKTYTWTYSSLQKHFPKDLKIKVQILNNKIFLMPSPATLHQRISNYISSRLTLYVEDNQLGEIFVAPMDTKFDENNVEQPDILFISIERKNSIDELCIDGAPDLVVEIWSPSNTKKEKQLKKELYQKNNVKEFWQIFPKEKKITIEILNNHQEYEIFSEATQNGQIQSKIIEGFTLSLEKIFP